MAMRNLMLLLFLPCLIACNSKVYDLNALSNDRPTALIFIGTECPISLKYIAKINQLAADYPGIRFLGVFSPKESGEDIRLYRQENNVRFPTITDENNVLLHQLGATHTPEVYLVSVSKEIIYFGAIDNWYYDLEQLHREPTDHFLKNAIESFLQHKPVLLKDTRPVGCRIEQ